MEHTTAQTRDFQINLDCELDRQSKLQEAFETREDGYSYIDHFECKGRLEMMKDWQMLPASYWKDNPGTPVGRCFTPTRDGRTDERPIREPDWNTERWCKDQPTVMPIKVNARGVRGCATPTEDWTPPKR
jgi:hypothetical protein